MPNRTTHAEAPRLDVLRATGVMTAADLRKAVRADKGRADLVEGLIRERSRNLLAGDSGLGKTPLIQQLGLCVASGLPFLGRPVRKGRVLFVDGESDRQGFLTSLDALTKHLGLPGVPDDFLCWSPLWAESECSSPGASALHHASTARVDLVIIDPLRVFFPVAETKAEAAAKMYRDVSAVSREHGTAFIISHHLRKPDRKVKLPELATDALRWLQEAAGSRALINQSDLRIGVEARADHQSGDLVLAGLLRGSGRVGPLYVERVINDAGDPQGYTLMQGAALLPDHYREALRALPLHEAFRFTTAKAVLGGNSDSNTSRFLQRCIDLELVYRVDGFYMRSDEPVAPAAPVNLIPGKGPAAPK